MKRLAVLFAMLLSLPASAQSLNCADREMVVAKLSGLGEYQSGLGLSNAGQVLEIWASDRTGTWTIVLSRTNGVSCIMSHGVGWSGLTQNLAPVTDKPA